MKSLNGFNHVNLLVRDRVRANKLTHVLMINGIIFSPLSAYFHQRNFSLASEQLYCRSIGLLIDFIAAKSQDYMELSRRSEFFNAFAHALKFGTISNGDDPSGLWWLPRSSSNIGQLLRATTEFSDWLVREFATAPLNPWRQASHAEKILFWRKWSHTSSNSMLTHLKFKASASEQANSARRVALPIAHLTTTDEPGPAFPEHLFPSLLTKGFSRRGWPESSHLHLRQNIRDMLVAVLMHGGGLRVSEPFHLFVPDVYEDPNDSSSAIVRVHHPSEGKIEVTNSLGRPETMNRISFLNMHHGRRPLDHEGKRTGWKNNLIHPRDYFMPVYWFPQYYGKLFMRLFKLYIEHSRPRSELPWLFLTESGLPMTAKAYAHQYYSAIARIGVKAKKGDGTTPHGHRHAYAHRLERAKEAGLIDAKVVQLCLHHRSITSQEKYGDKNFGRTSDILSRASESIFGEDRDNLEFSFNKILG